MAGSRRRPAPLLPLLAVVLSCWRAGAEKPNIVFILADDLGYNDVGYHGSEIRTPIIDALAAGGVRLESYYTHYVCSPTRASFLTGRYPIRYGWQHENPPIEKAPIGLPLSEVLLPQRLKEEAGYRTHAVGKWHLGYFSPAYLPTARGFDSHLGYYEAAMDYWNHSSTDDRLDLHNGTAEDNSPSCLPGLNGTYSLSIFVDEAKRIIDQHDSSKPLFLYLPFQSVHTPLEVPQRFSRRYEHISDESRRNYAGMVSYLDEGVGSVLSSLKAKGRDFWHNTVVFFVSDNGGQPRRGGNNYPLRGCKHTVFEGGIRVVALAYSPTLLHSPGRIERGLMHVTDMHATILALAGLVPNSTDASRPLDGFDQWPTVSQGLPSPRSELLVNIDPIYNYRLDRTYNSSALRRGPWKLIRGPFANCSPITDPLNCGWHQPPLLDAGSAVAEQERRMLPTSPAAGEEELVALFNVEEDPFEVVDVKAEYPEVVADLLARLDQLAAEAQWPLQAAKEDEAWAAAADASGCTAPWHA